MDYLVTRNFLLLLTVGAISNARGQKTRIAPAVPAMVNTCIGSNATIECTFGTLDMPKVKWYFGENYCNDSTKIELHSLYSSSTNRYHEEVGKNASYLTIINVNYNDSGWYCCEVIQDIPQLLKNTSGGCQLVIYLPTVTPDTSFPTTTCDLNTPTEHPWWLWVALTLSCTLVIIIVIITTILCRKKQEAPVYENTKDTKKQQWKEDPSLQHCMPSKGHSNKQMDTLKPHKYESHPKEISIYENTKEVSRRYGKNH